MPPVPSGTLDAMRNHFAVVAERDHVPGIAYALVVGHEIVVEGGVGVLRTGSPEEPGVDAASRLCSMTKSFVAAAVLLLRDEGRLALDDPIAQYVPELASLRPPTADSPRITIRSLLTMSSGLPEDDNWADRKLDLSVAGVEALLRAGATFARPPGIAFEYSNFGWVMLGRLVASVAGARVQDFVVERLLRPLGLGATSWDRPSQGPVMIGHRWHGDGWHEESPPLADGSFAALGGLWSTAADTARWVAFLLDAFPARDDPDAGPLCRASRREMQQLHRAWPSSYDPASGRLNAGGYGMGLMVGHDLRFGYVVGHPGGLPGFGSSMRWLPDRGVGVVTLGNATYASMDQATLEALELLDDRGTLPPAVLVTPTADLMRARGEMAMLLNAWDDTLADDLFATNVFQDEERDARHRSAAALRERCGPLTPGELRASGATAAAFDLHGPHGSVRVSLTLTPEVPPRIQTYVVEPLSSDDREGAESAPHAGRPD